MIKAKLLFLAELCCFKTVVVDDVTFVFCWCLCCCCCYLYMYLILHVCVRSYNFNAVLHVTLSGNFFFIAGSAGGNLLYLTTFLK